MKKAMVKKLVAASCAATLALVLTACGGEQPAGGATQEGATQATPSNPLEEVLFAAQTDISNTSQKLLDEKEKVFSTVGDTYDGYLANIQAIQDWYDLAVSETEGLGERLREQGREYYQAVVDNVDVSDDREVEKAKDDFYDLVYEDAFEDYYDAIYEDALEEFYDTYYDGVIADAQDTTPYDEWSDVRSSAYDAWSEARSGVYDAWTDARSDLYDDYSDITSAFYNNDFDVQGVFGPVEMKDNAGSGSSSDNASSSEAGSSESTEAAESTTTASASSEVSADFKAAMDEYEAVFDEYVEFMKEYGANPTSAALLAKYPDMMSQYSETMTAIGQVDTSSLTAADASYYAEVVARINAKVAEAV